MHVHVLEFTEKGGRYLIEGAVRGIPRGGHLKFFKRAFRGHIPINPKYWNKPPPRGGGECVCANVRQSGNFTAQQQNLRKTTF